MKGLELSYAYFQTYGIELLNRFKKIHPYCCIGLVGEGSECFGYDDEYSYDHDLGANFCIFMPEKIYLQYGSELQNAYNQLPKTFNGITMHQTSTYQQRTGVISIERFYRKYTNCIDFPPTNVQWLAIPESYLAVCTNGEIFIDYYGKFTTIRNTLLDFYPEDVRLFKLANRLANMAQSGQYNYPRLIKRNMYDAAYLALNEFIKHALSAIFLLNKVYMPFYKWAFRKSEELPLLQEDINHLRKLIQLEDNQETASIKINLIETIAQDLVNELNNQHLSTSNDPSLQLHVTELVTQIKDQELQKKNILEDHI